MMTKQFNSIFLLSLLCFILWTSSSIVLNINDEKQPLICELSPNDENYFSLINATWDSDHPKKLFFSSEPKTRLITACPLSDANPDTPEMLLENINNETTCKNTLVPVITPISIDDDPNCDTTDEGSWYAAGYRVRTQTPFLNQNIHFGEVYYVCYSESKGIIFTLHTVYNGNRVKPFKTWKTDNEAYKIQSNLEQNPSQIDQKNKNPYEIQLVPFDDMIPMPWKLATLFDFNFISTNRRVKIALDELDRSVRSYSDRTSQSLQIVSGVEIKPGKYNDDDIVWFWRSIENGPFKISCMVANRKPKLNEIPCESVPQMENFILNTKVISDLVCCKFQDLIEENSSQNNTE